MFWQVDGDCNKFVKFIFQTDFSLQNNGKDRYLWFMKKVNAKSVLFLSLFFLNFFSVKNSFSQALTVSSSQLNFGNAYENAPDSVQLTIFNNLSHSVNVTGMKFYTTYGSPAFSSRLTNFNIPGSSSQIVWIKFSPSHNIFHNSELVIENDGLRGYVSVDLRGQGKYSNTYYDLSENLAEEDLKTALQDITGTGYLSLGYNIARDSMFMWLDNQHVNGQGNPHTTFLESIYTLDSAWDYSSRTACQTTFSFNTEHTFPQGFFDLDGIGGGDEPMKSDLHHLFPTDDASNNYRANNPFGVVASPTWTSGGSKGTTSLFEPRDVQKGASARAMMYFVLRYLDYNNFFNSQENILRTWHHNFPPSTVETKRNNDINIIQHNRNPFVDYPQFIDRIHSIANFSVAPVSPSIDLTEDTIVYGFVPQGVPQIFHYVIVNNGNTTVSFSNFHLGDLSHFSFLSGGNDTSIAPGEALGINIRLITTSGNALHDSLTFQANVPSSTSVKRHIFANDPLINAISDINVERISLFPNPVHQLLIINHSSIEKDCNLVIYDITGKEMMFETLLKNNSATTIDVSSLSNGMYFLKSESDTNVFFRKFVKQ